MPSDDALRYIKDTLGQMKNPVRLVVFTSESGCAQCPDVLDLARSIKSRSTKIALEAYDLTMDRDKTEQYGITLTPSVVVQGAEGKSVTLCGEIDGIMLSLLLETVLAVSGGKTWFPDSIGNALKLLERDVRIQVFVDLDCPLCKPVAETATGLAMESGLIHTEIITADDFPKLRDRYQVATPPKTVFGGNLHLDGHVSESTFLEMIFKAEGLRPMESVRRCMVCGASSADIICTTCKSKIQAEAVDHKRRDEKFKRAGAA